MSELEPFLDGCDDFERTLLRSTRRDAPPAGALPKTLAALGLGASAITSATGAGAASAAVSAGSLRIWAVVVKALAVGMLAGTALTAVAVTVSDEPPRARPSVVVPMPRAPAAVVAPAAALVRAAVPMPAASEARGDIAILPAPAKLNLAPNAGDGAHAAGVAREPELVAQALNSVSVSSLTPPAPTPPATAVAAFAAVSDPARELPAAASIAEEVKMLDRARRALAAGRASEAMNDANTYLARWPNGSLTIEAVIVRIESELAFGDRASAERDARGVIAAHPGSRYASRVSALFSPPLPSKSE